MRLPFVTLAVTVVIACSAHQRRIDQAKHDGNEQLAECYETCASDDEACAAGCKQTFPTRWYQPYAGAAKPFIEVGMVIQAKTAGALHPLAVQDARAHNPPLAACYETCDPADAKCLRACDAKHGSDEDKRRRREMYMQVAKAGLDIYLETRRQRAATETSTASASTTSTGTTSSTSDSTSKPPPQTPTPTPAGACTCKGWPLGSPDAKTERPARCTPMSSGNANACDAQCKASGYAIGLHQGYGSC
jgi:hypothetical protein